MTKPGAGIDLTTADLGTVRFAISPLTQLVGALIGLTGRPTLPGMREWEAARRPKLEALCRSDPLLALLVELLRVTTYVPDCLSAPPVRPVARLHAELERVRAIPAEALRADLRRSAEQHRRGLARPELVPAVGRDLPQRLAGSLLVAWDTLIADLWGPIQGVLEQDIAYRGRVLSRDGLSSTLAGLDTGVLWRDDGQLELAGRSGSWHRPGGTGLWLVPSAFGGGWLCLDPPQGYALIYPARGTGNLFAPAPAPPPALARLIGRSRAQILRRLDQPTSTTQLAAALNMTLGAAGDHLGILRDARLVTRQRTGRQVLYARTELAESLLAHSGETAPEPSAAKST